MEDKIRQMIREAYALDELPEDTAHLSRIGDSLSFMEGIIDIEEEFDIKLDDDRLAGITSVGEFIGYVTAVIESKGEV